MSRHTICIVLLLAATCVLTTACRWQQMDSQPADKHVVVKDAYKVGHLKPVDSTLKVKVGQQAPDFTLPNIDGGKTSLSQFRGESNVVISFVPAAWTPVCGAQWPAYNISKNMFDRHEAMLVGVTTDNVPSLFAWTENMGGVWFPVVSDFWPHGKVADTYGVLRSDGTTERALFIVDKQGVIRYIDVHDINEMPSLEVLRDELAKVQ
jgi:peroxiredoxin (alkyl hydroperoxide reductase subunit C)